MYFYGPFSMAMSNNQRVVYIQDGAPSYKLINPISYSYLVRYNIYINNLLCLGSL